MIFTLQYYPIQYFYMDLATFIVENGRTEIWLHNSLCLDQRTCRGSPRDTQIHLETEVH